MFPDPCGIGFEEAVAAGADPFKIVPDNFALVRGGASSVPGAGTVFSASVGPFIDIASAALPYGTIRVTSVGEIRKAGGSVEWRPETTRYGTINRQHVNVTEAGTTSFAEAVPNPVPCKSRIDGEKRK